MKYTAALLADDEQINIFMRNSRLICTEHIICGNIEMLTHKDTHTE